MEVFSLSQIRKSRDKPVGLHQPTGVVNSTTGIRAQELVLCNPLICHSTWLLLCSNCTATYLDCCTARTEVEGWIHPSWLWAIRSKTHHTTKSAGLAYSWFEHELWGFLHIVYLRTFPALACILDQCINPSWHVLQCHQVTANLQDLLCTWGIHSLLEIHWTGEFACAHPCLPLSVLGRPTYKNPLNGSVSVNVKKQEKDLTTFLRSPLKDGCFYMLPK